MKPFHNADRKIRQAVWELAESIDKFFLEKPIPIAENRINDYGTDVQISSTIAKGLSISLDITLYLDALHHLVWRFQVKRDNEEAWSDKIIFTSYLESYTYINAPSKIIYYISDFHIDTPTTEDEVSDFVEVFSKTAQALSQDFCNMLSGKYIPHLEHLVFDMTEKLPRNPFF